MTQRCLLNLVSQRQRQSIRCPEPGSSPVSWLHAARAAFVRLLFQPPPPLSLPQTLVSNPLPVEAFAFFFCPLRLPPPWSWASTRNQPSVSDTSPTHQTVGSACIIAQSITVITISNINFCSTSFTRPALPVHTHPFSLCPPLDPPSR